jgi:hypothetical protein
VSPDHSTASPFPAVIAPDGIAIHAFDLPGGAFTGIAEGRISPGRFAIHRHLTIEQYTYVLAGAVTALIGSSDAGRWQTVSLHEGDLLLSKPGDSLEFVNSTGHVARVLFICTPPYPADNSDTQLLEAHTPPSRGDLDVAMQRLEAFRKNFNRDIDRRIVDLLSKITG